jgi:hypothetical protein
MYIATHIFSYLPICLSVYLSFCSSIHPSVHLPTCLSVWRSCPLQQSCSYRMDSISSLWAFVRTPSAWDRPVTRRLSTQDNTKAKTRLCVHGPIVTVCIYSDELPVLSLDLSECSIGLFVHPTAPVNLRLLLLIWGYVN